MKYYIYISDAKVDMLFPQVPHDIKKKVATEWKMDLKLLSASRRVETEAEDNRIARLETVVDFINQYGDVGSIDEPGEYIQGTETLKWGSYGFNPQGNPAVYFHGGTRKTIFGLGGSMHHLIGNSKLSFTHSQSYTYTLVAYLAKELDLRTRESEQQYAADAPKHITPLMAVEWAKTEMDGPGQKVGFLAKKLVYGPIVDSSIHRKPGKFGLLATPLYVAMAD
jgi:hypothetical protein